MIPEFHDPLWLFLAFIPLALLVLELRAGGRWRAGFSSLLPFRDAGKGWRVYARELLIPLRAVGMLAMIVALARPIEPDRTRSPISGEGIDIALLVDCSGSMRAEDMASGKSRLEVVKEVLRRFVDARRGDRMGIISFARYPLTICPFTLDADTVKSFVDRLEPASLRGEDGTAIGVALAQAARRLKKSTAKSKIVVLLTDGVNNVDDITPEQATTFAAELGIRVYTIMAGRDSDTPWYPVTPEGRPEAEPLQEIARATGGRFFRAEDEASLGDIYSSIDELERSRFDEQRTEAPFTDLFRPWLFGGLGALLLATVLDHTWLRRLP